MAVCGFIQGMTFVAKHFVRRAGRVEKGSVCGHALASAPGGEVAFKTWVRRSLTIVHPVPPSETMPEDIRRLVELFPLNSAAQKRP